MSDYKIFILLLLEVGSLMLLWNMFNKKQERRFQKSVFIILTTSIVALITNYIYPPLQFIVNYLFLFIIIKLLFKKEIKYMLLEFGLLMAAFAVIQLLTIILLQLFLPVFKNQEFPFYLIANSICLIFCYCIYKFAPYKKLMIFYRQESFKIYFLSINLLSYILIAKWAWNFKRSSFLESIVLYLVIPIVFILVNLIYLEYATKNNERKKALEDYRKYSPVISSLLEDIRRRQHDFKNHLNTIYSMILVSDEKYLKETITKYIKSLNHSLVDMEKMLQIDNAVVAAIIYNKINEAKKQNIDFRYIIQRVSKLPYKDHELSEVLNNLLDNAFDAVQESDIEVKKVFLNLGHLEGQCILEVGNSGHRIDFNDICRIFEAGYTTKAGNNRGYGLYQVKKIVESYGGRIQLSFENNFTVFSVRL